MLVLPFVVDQIPNAKKIECEGLGNMYHERLKEFARLFLDQPMPGIEKAIWWMEYVIRHKGAKHLRNPIVDIPLYQYLMLDIIATHTASLPVLIHAARKFLANVLATFFESEVIQDLLKNNSTKKYDLVIVEDLFPEFIIFGEVYRCPTILIHSTDSPPSIHRAMGNSIHPVVYSEKYYACQGTLNVTFLERFGSTLHHAFLYLVRGHHVTLLTTDPMGNRSLTNLTEYNFHEVYKHKEELPISLDTVSLPVLIHAAWKLGGNVLATFFESEVVQDLLKNNSTKKYDLVVVEAIFPEFIIFGEVYRCPTILIVIAMGNSIHPVVYSEQYYACQGTLNVTFLERFGSTLHYAFINLVREKIM
nr:unnamed protein product [Callosobruchus analis]